MTGGKKVHQPGSIPGCCVIMAGGRGTRFWPLSRKSQPKQFLALSGGRSLVRETFDRIEPVVGSGRILVITSADLADTARGELPELAADHVIGEPVGCNTAPCAALGGALAERIAPGEPVVFLPADHFIPDEVAFQQQLGECLQYAAGQETVVTLGIRPTRPETGYGYIATGPDTEEGIHPGLTFVEKPDLPTAEKYLQGGRHLWNSGIFIWNVRYFQDMFGRFIPDVVERMAVPAREFGTSGFSAALEDAYRGCPADSLDFAVMEKLPGFSVLAARFGWSDLGSWDVWGELAPDLTGTNRGLADLLAVDSRDNVVFTEDKLVALVGVDDLIVVDTPDALLVCRKDQAQRIKEVIEEIENCGRTDLL